MKSSDSIKVSVVVAVYNGASTLPRCLDSVIGQTYPNIEVICVNDCSPDDSHLVLERYAQEYPQIRVINHTENKHGGGADNTGIKAAQGDYVCILDQDDWLESDAIEVLVNNSNNGSIEIVLGQWQQVSVDGVTTKQHNMIIGGTLEDNICHAFMYGCRILGGLFKKSLFVDNNLWYPEKVNWADNGLYNAVIMVAKSIRVVDSIVYNYYIGIADSSSKTISVKSIKDRIYTTNLCYDRCTQLDVEGKYTNEIKYRYLALTRYTIEYLCDMSEKDAKMLFNLMEKILSQCVDTPLIERFEPEVQYRLVNAKSYLNSLFYRKKVDKIKRPIRRVCRAMRLFIPPIFGEVKRKLHPRKLVNACPLPMREKQGKRIVIIGNGPSLNPTMDKYEYEVQHAECMMVNFSASTPMFERIKPCLYVFSDAGWHSKPELTDMVRRLVDSIVSKTQWPMTMVMPASFCNWWALEELRKNKNITIWFDYGRWLELPEEETFRYFDNNVLTPPSNTVLTYCLYLALYWGYEETYIVGADTSFSISAYVGQKDNVVYTIDPHFYENNDVQKPETIDPEKLGRPYGMNMEQYMHMCYMHFYEYGLLARYAKWKGLKVYNASEFSMIDCFERKKLRNENDNEKI